MPRPRRTGFPGAPRATCRSAGTAQITIKNHNLHFMSSRPNSGGGSRPRRRPRNSNRGARSGGDHPVRREPRRQLTFWDKIKQFFGVAPAAAPARDNGRETRREERAPGRSRLREESSSDPAPRTIPKPEAVEVTTPRLYIGNLSYDASESDIFELFGGVGTVQNVEIIANKHTQRSKGFGFVQMSSVTDAKRAVEELHDKEFMGRKLVVSGAKLPGDRTESPESPAQD